MGLIRDYAEFLLASKLAGARFDRTITLGRLKNYVASGGAGAAGWPTERYAEGFFREVLGARQLDALDYSSYEGASLCHDLSVPVPSELEGCCDAVIDGGTLEHVFGFPAAIQNMMRMLKPSGSLFICTPANNHSGHGFYQFSPDLFYRIFSASNGFRVEKMAWVMSNFVEVERGSLSRRYQVLDPALVGVRSLIVSTKPATLMVHAVREGAMPAQLTVLQSDYQVLWKKAATGSAGSSSGPARKSGIHKRFLRALAGCLSRSLEQSVRSRYEAWRFRNVRYHPCFREAPADYFATRELDASCPR